MTNDEYNKETLQILQRSTNRMWFCIDAAENYYYFMSYWYDQFANFNNLLLSFFNGLLNNIVSYTNLIGDIDAASKAGDRNEMAYHIARMIRITLDFDPILFTDSLLLAAP